MAKVEALTALKAAAAAAAPAAPSGPDLPSMEDLVTLGGGWMGVGVNDQEEQCVCTCKSIVVLNTKLD